MVVVKKAKCLGGRNTEVGRLIGFNPKILWSLMPLL